MCKLALSDELLMKLDKPSRYIGGEVNMVKKNPNDVDIRFAMCFPDVYEIGMSHLGIQILYDMFNKREDTYCERVYSPWPDLDKEMRENNIPLFGINYNPTQWRWTDSKKVFAQLYIDDAALGVPLKLDTSISSRPFVDWDEVAKLLINLHII